MLLKFKLVVCVNVVRGVKFRFWWKGAIEECEEALLICKSSMKAFHRLLEEVKKMHSYSVPEIIGVPIIIGNKEYIKWLRENIKDNFKD